MSATREHRSADAGVRQVGLTLFLLVLVLGACSRHDDSPGLQAGSSVTSTDTLLPVFGAGVIDSDFVAYSVAISGSKIVMIAGQEPLILLVDTASGQVDSLSREGAGPGEFRSPVSAWFTPEGISIFDRGLGRITRFSERGELLGEVQLVASASAALGLAGRPTLFATEGGNFFGHFIRDDGSLRMFGTRTQDRVPGTRDPLAMAGGGRYFVYEAASGLLMTLDSLGGNLFPPKRIPGWLFDALSEQFSTMTANSKIGPRVTASAPSAKFILGTPAGEAILFYAVAAHPELGFAVRFDPKTSDFERLPYPADSTAADYLFRAGTAATDGRSLIVSGLRGTAMFRMPG